MSPCNVLFIITFPVRMVLAYSLAGSSVWTSRETQYCFRVYFTHSIVLGIPWVQWKSVKLIYGNFLYKIPYHLLSDFRYSLLSQSSFTQHEPRSLLLPATRYLKNLKPRGQFDA